MNIDARLDKLTLQPNDVLVLRCDSSERASREAGLALAKNVADKLAERGLHNLIIALPPGDSDVAAADEGTMLAHGWQKARPHLRAAMRTALEKRTQECTSIVLNGGDGKNRLETAIRFGPNAAIAEAILALLEK